MYIPVDAPTILNICTTVKSNVDWRIAQRLQLATSLCDLILISQPSVYIDSPTFGIPVWTLVGAAILEIILLVPDRVSKSVQSQLLDKAKFPTRKWSG